MHCSTPTATRDDIGDPSAAISIVTSCNLQGDNTVSFTSVEVTTAQQICPQNRITEEHPPPNLLCTQICRINCNKKQR